MSLCKSIGLLLNEWRSEQSCLHVFILCFGIQFQHIISPPFERLLFISFIMHI